MGFDSISEDRSSETFSEPFLVNTCFIHFYWVLGHEEGLLAAELGQEEGLLAAAGNDLAEKKII